MSKEKECLSVSSNNLYEINKQLMKNEPVISKEKEDCAIQGFYNFFKKFIQEKYFLLLSNELHDYTVFNITNIEKIDNAVKDLIEIINERGAWLAAELTEDNNAWEIWIKSVINKSPTVFYLFPCSQAVLEY